MRRDVEAHWKCPCPAACSMVHMSPPPPPPSQSHSDQTPRSTSVQRPPSARSSLFGSLQHNTVKFRTLKPNKHVHSLRSGVHDAVHSECRRHIHQEPLGHNTLESCDTLSEVWEAQPAMAQGRFNACAAGIRGRIYVVGGRVGTGRIRVPSSALTAHGPRCHP